MRISMAPDPVRHIDRDIGQMAAEAEQHTDGLLNACARAADGNPGWGSADELRKLGQVWEAHVDRLLTDTADVGHRLTKSAESVSRSDQEIEQEFRQVLIDMGSGPS